MWLKVFSVSVTGEKFNEKSGFRQVINALFSYEVNYQKALSNFCHNPILKEFRNL
jgi:hypothetical protein